jgi:hypothetical protein
VVLGQEAVSLRHRPLRRITAPSIYAPFEDLDDVLAFRMRHRLRGQPAGRSRQQPDEGDRPRPDGITYPTNL